MADLASQITESQVSALTPGPLRREDVLETLAVTDTPGYPSLRLTTTSGPHDWFEAQAATGRKLYAYSMRNWSGDSAWKYGPFGVSGSTVHFCDIADPEKLVTIDGSATSSACYSYQADRLLAQGARIDRDSRAQDGMKVIVRGDKELDGSPSGQTAKASVSCGDPPMKVAGAVNFGVPSSTLTLGAGGKLLVVWDAWFGAEYHGQTTRGTEITTYKQFRINSTRPSDTRGLEPRSLWDNADAIPGYVCQVDGRSYLYYGPNSYKGAGDRIQPLLATYYVKAETWTRWFYLIEFRGGTDPTWELQSWWIWGAHEAAKTQLYHALQFGLGQLGPGVAATAFTKTVGGTETLTYTATATQNSLTHDIPDVAGEIDVYYQFAITPPGAQTTLQVRGRLQTTSPASGNGIHLYAYNWTTSAWELLRSNVFLATETTSNTSYRADIETRHVGTGGNEGLIRLRFANTGLKSGEATLKIDHLLANEERYYDPYTTAFEWCYNTSQDPGSHVHLVSYVRNLIALDVTDLADPTTLFEAPV